VQRVIGRQNTAENPNLQGRGIGQTNVNHGVVRKLTTERTRWSERRSIRGTLFLSERKISTPATGSALLASVMRPLLLKFVCLADQSEHSCT
jgi:hypothetical protein